MKVVEGCWTVWSPKGEICLSRGREPAEMRFFDMGAAQRRHIEA